jgi:hypothetical protein
VSPAGAEVVREIERETEAVGAFLQTRRQQAEATATQELAQAAVRRDAGAARINDMVRQRHRHLAA